MWNKISNYVERIRKFWREDGSYTFILVPNDGKEFKRKTYDNEYLRKCARIVGGCAIAFVGSLLVMHGVIFKCLAEHRELTAFRENHAVQTQKLHELSVMSERIQKDMATLATIEKNVLKQMDKYGICLSEECKSTDKPVGLGGPSAREISETTVLMEQNKNLHQQLQHKTEDWNKLLTKLKKENYRREMTPNVWPTNSHYVTSEFGGRYNPFDGYSSDWHGGLDIADNYGAPVYATASGYVEYSGWYYGYGKYIRINHDYGYKTAYAHMSELYVSHGDYVTKGEVIGAIGSTGNSTGPHLHYEVLLWGQETNPRDLM
ncbi:MAG: M23 family metallopeptidase [Phascolarctobacterium sp.]|nr:M23 family metallopeptidase [Phascolarctobacterium sp.]